MTKLFKYLKPYKWQVILVLGLTLAQVFSQLFLPNLMGEIIDVGIQTQDISFIIRTGLAMLGFTIIVSITTIGARYLSSRSSVGFARDLRRDVFMHIENYSLNEFDKIGTASLITRTTNDITQVQNVMVMMLSMLIMAPLTAIGGTVMAVEKDPKLSLILLVVIAVMAILVLFVVKFAMPLFKSQQKKLDRVNLVLREGLTGMRVIRAFNKTEFEKNRFDTANKDLTQTSIKIFRIMSFLMPVVMLLFNITTVAIIWFGAQRIDAGIIEVGDMVAFQQYAMQIMFGIMMSLMLMIMIPRASASAARINEVLDMPLSIKASETPVLETSKKGYVEFNDVSFAYHGAQEPVLCNISFEAKPGEVTAIIGGTGSGKSTVAKLIPRFYDVRSGSVLVDGVDVRELGFDALRNKIGWVPQNINLFHGTIADNIRFGRENATDGEVQKALETAQAKEFIDELDEGIQSEVSQGGTNYSGGQKQRLSIARALIRHPEIYIFDDSFSALDFKTDARLRKALKNETKDSTVLIVAQRVSTVMDANTIIVLDNGKMVGKGTHKQLMESCEIYQEIVASQLSEEELA